MIIVKPCITMKGYNIILNKKINLDLLLNCLKNKSYEEVIKNEFILVVRKKYLISVFPNGKILIRDLEDKKVAKAIANEILNCLNER